MTDELIAAEGEWLPGVARWKRTGLDLVNDRRRPTMLATTQAPRRLGAALLAAVADAVVAACGGTTTTPSAAAAAAARAAGGERPGRRARRQRPASAPASAAPACGTTPARRSRSSYAMWGDTTELANQQKIVDAFHAAEPEHHRQGRRWPTGTPTGPSCRPISPGGNAPDVFLMDGPLFPDYQTRDQLLDLDPYIAKDGFDTGLSSSTSRVQDFTAADGHHYGLPARPEHDRAVLQQDDVRRGGDPVPGRRPGTGTSSARSRSS